MDVSDDKLIHADHRAKRIRLGAFWSVASKVSSLVVTVVSIPAAMNCLGNDRFGLWITLTSIFGLFGFMDGGIGNAVVNIVSENRVKQNALFLSGIISSAYAVLSSVCLFGCALTFVLAFSIDWRWIVLLPESISVDEARYAVCIVGVAFFLNIPLGLAARIRHGRQETHFNALLEILSSSVVLSATIFAAVVHGSMAFFLIAFASGPLLANTVSTILLNIHKNKGFAVRLISVTKSNSGSILRRGMAFLGLQISFALSFQIDAIVAAHYLGLGAAADLGIVTRLFVLATSFVGLVLIPLWPAIADAKFRGDIAWIRNAFARTLALATSASLAITIPLLIWHTTILNTWSGRELSLPISLVIATFIWTNLLVIGNSVAVLLNGMNMMRLQLFCAIIMAAINLPLSIYLAQTIGVAGVVFGSVISYTLCVLLPVFIIMPNVLREKRTF